jgi:hypothetical protein
MAQFLLAVHHSFAEPPPDPAEMEAMFADVDAFNTALQDAGAWVFAGGLTPPDAAKVVRVTTDRAHVDPGPFTPAEIQLGGFWVIDVTDEATALGFAVRAARATRRPVEVRAFQAMPDDA